MLRPRASSIQPREEGEDTAPLSRALRSLWAEGEGGLARDPHGFGRIGWTPAVDPHSIHQELASQHGELCPSVSRGPSFSFGVLGRTSNDQAGPLFVNNLRGNHN